MNIIDEILSKPNEIEDILNTDIEEYHNENIELTNITIKRTNFKNVSILNSKIDRCSFLDCDFQNCNFSNTIFDNCSFIRCKFTNCKLTGCNFVENVLFEINFKDIMNHYFKILIFSIVGIIIYSLLETFMTPHFISIFI